VTIGDSFSTILAPPLRNRKFVDSLLEGVGFELRVPLPEKRLWLRQGLNRRPQLIDQRLAVANLPSFLDAG